MKKLLIITSIAASLVLELGCTVITQGEVGLRQVWGRMDPMPLPPGRYRYRPRSTEIIRVPIRSVTKTIDVILPSKEGMNVQATISIIYRIDPAHAADVIGMIGPNYEETLIAAVFRSQAADVSARFFAKDMYSSERSSMETEIAEGMRTYIGDRGFIVEAVLMKSISLPPGLAGAIEQKLEAEQEAEQMRFQIEREKLEAERKRIEAEGIRDAQQIISEGLTPSILQLRQIEAMRDLARSSNAKLIVTEPGAPMILQAVP
jgi:prohibitin 1